MHNGLFCREKIKSNGGQVLLLGITLFLFISVSFITGISNPILRQAGIAGDFIASRKSFFASEAGIEDAIYRIRNNKQISPSESLSLDGVSATISVADTYGTKTITSSGSGRSLIRNVKTILKTGVGSSFSYGVQSGAGGFILGNNARINGSVYSNGSIVGSNGAVITGTAVSAGSGGLIDRVSIGSGGIGNAEAYQVKNSTIAGSLYCQIGSSNNKPCDVSKPINPVLDFPVIGSDIEKWKADALAGGVINGDYTLASSVSLGPKKIVGNLSISNGKILTLTGTVWVTGNLNMDNNAQIRLDSSYGESSGIVVVGGRVSASNNSTFSGSGVSGSYVMVVTESDCPAGGSCDGEYAMDIANNVGAVILNAQSGTIRMSNGAAAKQLTAYKIFLDNNAVINYEQGVANTIFTNGPTGGWEINSWAETE